MNIIDTIHEYYIRIVCIVLIVVIISLVLVISIVPYPSFVDTKLYDIFRDDVCNAVSITYACTFVISSILLIDGALDIHKYLFRNSTDDSKHNDRHDHRRNSGNMNSGIFNYNINGNSTSTDSISTLSSTLREKSKPLPLPLHDIVSYTSASTTTSSTTAITNAHTTTLTRTNSASSTSINAIKYNGKEIMLLVSNTCMILSFLIPSFMMIITSSTSTKCIFYCSAIQLQYLSFPAWLTCMFYSFVDMKIYTILLLVQFVCLCIEKICDIVLDFYGTGGSSSSNLILTILKVPFYVHFILALAYSLLYAYGSSKGVGKRTSDIIKNDIIRSPSSTNDSSDSPNSSTRSMNITDNDHYDKMHAFMTYARQQPDILFHLVLLVYVVIGVMLCMTLFPFDDFKVRNHRNESLYHVVSTNWVLVFYLVFIVLKNSHRKTSILEKAYNELNKLNKKIYNEKIQYERVLTNLVPSSIVHDLNEGKTIEPRFHKNCCIFVSNITGFDKFLASSTPLQVFLTVDKLFRVIDTCLEQFPLLYKIETRPDDDAAYLVVCGLQFVNDVADDMYRNGMLSELVLFSFLVQDVFRYTHISIITIIISLSQQLLLYHDID